jgi:hypothetical protein
MASWGLFFWFLYRVYVSLGFMSIWDMFDRLPDHLVPETFQFDGFDLLTTEALLAMGIILCLLWLLNFLHAR